MPTPYWITATPPAPHGELHIGHLAGPYVAADVLARFLRADGRPVRFATGTADHAASVEARALRTGRKPAEVAEGYRAAITADWRRSGITFDRIVHPRGDQGYTRWIQELFARLHADGVIAPRARLLPYCASCDRWLHGAHVTGGCPHCGRTGAGGTCRACARPNDGGDLLDPTCTRCDTPARPRRCRRLYLPLEPFRDPLADHWAASALPPRLAALCEGLIEDGLPDVAVGHPGEWGIPVPVEEFADHRIDACFETAAMQLFGHGAHEEELPERSVHFCGYGHAFCHAVLLPVLLLAQGLKLPQDFCVNEDFRIGDGGPEGVWALDLLTEFGSDTLRRHVLQARPAGRSTGFDRERLARARRVLDTTWNGWLARVFAAVREESAGVVPGVLPGGTGWDRHVRRVGRGVEELREAYDLESFDPRRAVAMLDEIVRATDDFGHLNTHERRRPHRDGRHLAPLVAQLSVAAGLTAWARPVMPEGADRLAAALRIAPGGPVTAQALAAPAAGTRLDPPSGPVFGF
ncbi:class I tRNA ligase family protein [Streptomyces sp. NPDC058000]|uniref:class I tRNA ligase family protein n=1 Tax=Streptomyces sp. NPDC058000 TaxID=3346299 RepID=UPI0036E521EA